LTNSNKRKAKMKNVFDSDEDDERTNKKIERSARKK
jgi:hypothetical protein